MRHCASLLSEAIREPTPLVTATQQHISGGTQQTVDWLARLAANELEGSRGLFASTLHAYTLTHTYTNGPISDWLAR